MSSETIEVRPAPKEKYVILKSGEMVLVPEGWVLLPPGDAALSRRIKKDGPTWTMKKRKGNKEFSLGIWAPAERIDALRLALESERSDPGYEKKLEAGRKRRALEEANYKIDFARATYEFLNFHSRYQKLAESVAELITNHAIPVGSGTVARTKRIPIEERVERATIAWLRHQTTAYDHMHIPRMKGARREVRRQLAKESKRLLKAYRDGVDVDALSCPLQRAT
jgi:hypothetical protein